MFCEYCGNKLPDGSKFCASCGHPVEAPAAPQTRKEKPVKKQQGNSKPPQPDEGKKGIVIALSIVLAILVIAAIVLGIIFFGMGAGNQDSNNGNRVEKVSGHKDNRPSGTEEVFSGQQSTQSGSGEAVSVESTEGAAETNKSASESDELFKGDKKEFVFSDSDVRKLTEEEIEDMLDESDDPVWDIRIAINELYARHGRMFDSPEVREYFESLDWYEGSIEAEEFDKYQNEYLSEIEIYNRDLLSRYRDELKN